MEKWDPTLPAKGNEAALRASEQDATRALNEASDFLDTLPFKGWRLSPDQPRSWPRGGLLGKDGQPVLGTPKEVEEAAYMVAGFILAGIPFNAPALGWVFLKIGHLIDESQQTLDRSVMRH